jgi:hypothetical protein
MRLMCALLNFLPFLTTVSPVSGSLMSCEARWPESSSKSTARVTSPSSSRWMFSFS